MADNPEIGQLTQRLAEAERKAAELQAVVESIGDAIFIGNTEGLTWANQYAFDHLGFEKPEELLKDLDAVVAELQTRDATTNLPLSAEEQPFALALQGQKNAREIRARHRLTGEDRIVRSSAAPVVMDGRMIGAVGINTDITEQKRAEERQAFLLRVSDTLRPLSDAGEIQHAAMKLLAEKHDVMRAMYLELGEDGDMIMPAARFERDAVPTPDILRLSDYSPDIADGFRKGETLFVRDTEAEASSQAHREAYRAIGVGAWIVAPLVKHGKLVAVVGVQSRTPRNWTALEIQMVDDIADRTWAAVERARAEVALKESEERFQQFARASASALWIRDAETLEMEFVSHAIETIYGVKPERLLGDVRHWAAMILPDDREIALEHLEQARQGNTVVHEFRIRRASDGAFRWIRNTDFPLRDDGRIPRIGGIAEDVTDAKIAFEHQDVLLAELQHRVRNIMAMIRSMVYRSAEGAEDIENYRDMLSGRLLALARVQALLTREANAGGSLRNVLEAEIGAQAHDRAQYDLSGPDIALSPKAVEALTLGFHEMTTNALKYGALSDPNGRIRVHWSVTEQKERPWLTLDWVEEGAPPRAPSTRRGFGSELIEGKIPYELGGTARVSIEPGGARCHLVIPLTDGASILETDSPKPTAIFGGSIDMTGAADLTGRSVLVVEDDYYIAADTAAALRGAGAEVIGPCPNEDAARDLLESSTPTAAVIDINLGSGGPRFEIARMLKDRGIPFLFMTGYDSGVIPEDMAGITTLQKPVPLNVIVEEVAKL